MFLFYWSIKAPQIIKWQKDLYLKGLDHIDYRKMIDRPDTKEPPKVVENPQIERIIKEKEEKEKARTIKIGREENEHSDDDLLEIMDLLINKGYKTKEAAQEVAKENNVSKNYLYNLYLRRNKK